MKVPKMYKSSDRYNAGVDVIYDDDSKLQIAPFVYASTESGDNGADEGGDEEGDEVMTVHELEVKEVSGSYYVITKDSAETIANEVFAGKSVGLYLENADHANMYPFPLFVSICGVKGAYDNSDYEFYTVTLDSTLGNPAIVDGKIAFSIATD